MCEVTKIDKDLVTAELAWKTSWNNSRTDGKTKYDFNLFTSPLKFAEKIYTGELTSQETKDDQAQLEILTNRLDKEYNQKIKRKIGKKKEVLKSAEKLFYVRERILLVLLKKVFFGTRIKKKNQKKNQKKNHNRLKRSLIRCKNLHGLIFLMTITTH